MMSELKDLFGAWIAGVAAAIDAVMGWIVPKRRILLVEAGANRFTARVRSAKGAALPEVSFWLSQGRPQPGLTADWRAALRGSQVDILMQPDQVLFRPLDFPRQAADFLDGMVAAQIDRLTPWTAGEAVFGVTAPVPAANDRIALTLAATSRHKIEPLLKLAADLGAAQVTGQVAASDAGEAAGPITIFKRSLSASRKFDVPRLLRVSLAGASLAALVTFAASTYLVSSFEAEQQELQQLISQRRAALRLNQGGSSAELLLAKRKQTSASSVMVLEAISKVLPDTTYVSELRVEGDKMQVVGLTQDAPSLVRLIEQSPQFARATFFAPTTRAPEDPGERFHIEAHITPYFGSGS